MVCAWTPDEYTLEQSGTWDNEEEEAQERALYLATSSLIGLTYGRVGQCPITIRPCPEPAPCGCGFWPHMGVDGLWYNSCPKHGVTQCKPASEINIPGPVGYIEKFLIDGEDQIEDEAFYDNWRLDNGHLLVWQGAGESPVPSTQDLDKPDTAPGTWSITYSRSYPVALDGRIAVALLALEFAKAMKPKGKCSLPRGVTNVVRNGVSFTVQAGLFPNGLTNIDAVDAYILKWAPGGSPTQNAVVFDPSKHSPRRTNSVPKKAVV